jgi:glycosyltransferase involved in cell wall biosynthesis
MKSENDSDEPPPHAWAVGALPPPVTGMTLLTEKVVQRLQQAGSVTLCNYSHGQQRPSFLARTKRLARSLGCVGKVLANGRVRDGRLYLVANSRSGLILTCALVLVGRHLGHRIFLHHHTYGYVDSRNRWMGRIVRTMGERDTHVVHCDQMVTDFRRRYDTKSNFATIFPSVVSLEIQPPRLCAGVPFRLGMLSNLTMDKGVDLAIGVFRALHASGRQVVLTLAGPIRTRAAQVWIDDTLADYPHLVRHVGPVYGDAKAEFFAKIDALLFPTRYVDESWGIVLNESLAAAAPVITFDRGCTRTVVGDRAGLVVARDGDYVASAARQIGLWIDDATAYQAASAAAVEQAAFLHLHSQIQLDQFADRIFATRRAH